MCSKPRASPEEVLVTEKGLQRMEKLLAAFGAFAFPNIVNGALLVGQLVEDVTAVLVVTLVRQP